MRRNEPKRVPGVVEDGDSNGWQTSVPGIHCDDRAALDLLYTRLHVQGQVIPNMDYRRAS
jgi:hypothetical protein